MGAGKTVLVSSIIAHLHLSLQAGDVISYHFCRSDNPSSLLARYILGTLARQMLDKYIVNAEDGQLRTLRNACQNMNTEDVVRLLKLHLESGKRYYVVVDGLDECSQDQIVEVGNSMTMLGVSPSLNIKILYSGRPDLEYQLFQREKPKYRLPLTKNMVTPDIERYIDAELDHQLQKEQIRLMNPETILKIRDVLLTEHDGLILFVHLMIEELCMLGNENAILRALGGPSRKISDLIVAKFRRVQNCYLATDAITMLRYCGCTKRPLTINEFSELMSISTSQTSLDRTSIPQNMDQIVTACCGLIYIEEEEATVHYVHRSVRHHLFNNSDTRTEGFDENEVDIHFASLCLTYLNFADFKQQLKKVNKMSDKAVMPIEIGLASTQRYSSTISEVARKLLKIRHLSQQITTAELSRRTEDIMGEAESSRVNADIQLRPFYLLEYVQNYWIWHSSRVEENTRMWHRFLLYVRGENDLARRPWITDDDLPEVSAERSLASTAWAVVHDHPALLLSEILQKPCTLRIREKKDILQHAIAMNHFHLVFAMRNEGLLTSDLAQRGMFFAAHYGRKSFLSLFIGAGADIDAYTAELAVHWPPKSTHFEGVTSLSEGIQRSALQIAAGRGHLGVVERLLLDQADVNAPAGAMGGRTALQAAAEGNQLTLGERLLAAGADVNATPAQYRGRTALQAAAGSGHLAVVELLLLAQADVNAAPTTYFEGRTALQAAAEGGHLEVVERLLMAQADVNAAPITGYDGRTALQAAAKGGHLKVVERLLLAQADVNAPATGDKGRTALQAAAEGGHLEVVEELILAQADVNAAPTHNRGRTALQAAAGSGHLEVVERLLMAQADINAAPTTYLGGRTALQAAAEGGHLKVVEQLLLAGADVNAPGAEYDGGTALHFAVLMGFDEIEARLKHFGARK